MRGPTERIYPRQNYEKADGLGARPRNERSDSIHDEQRGDNRSGDNSVDPVDRSSDEGSV